MGARRRGGERGCGRATWLWTTAGRGRHRPGRIARSAQPAAAFALPLDEEVLDDDEEDDVDEEEDDVDEEEDEESEEVEESEDELPEELLDDEALPFAPARLSVR